MDTHPTNNLFSDDIESLFNKSDSYSRVTDKINILLVGRSKIFKKFKSALGLSSEYNVNHVTSIDESITLLLVDIFGIVIIDNDDNNIDAITVSRLVRINHPLARILVVSKRRGSSLIATIINYGAVDGFLTLPFRNDKVQIMMSEQQAKHIISKMLTNFVSQPPKLSKASYLLLDPTLSFSDEDEPVKFVGLMIAYKSVPRFTRFFEELLAKDEILFAGYLSGITMLGRELFTNKEPLKEINFGGVSVIFRFHDDLQISVFVRGLTRYNFKFAEDTITEIIEEILDKYKYNLEDVDIISENAYNGIHSIIRKLELANELKSNEITSNNSIAGEQSVLLVGSDKNNQNKIKNYIERKHKIKVLSTTQNETAYKYMSKMNCGVLLLDSKLKGNKKPLTVAEYAKEISPSIQIIYRIRDRRASSPLIQALNSGLVNTLLPYKSSYKELTKWTLKAFNKAKEIKERSLSGENLEKALDQATIARTMIRKNVELYNPENKPELHGIFVSKENEPIFQIFWSDPKTGQIIEFDLEMMAGLVASLDNVGEEMFSETESIGKLELGGANILVKHRGKFNFAFFVKNIDPNTSIVVNKEISNGTDKLFNIIQNSDTMLNSPVVQASFDTSCNNFYSDFMEKFKK